MGLFIYPVFRYSARDREAKLIAGTIEAKNEDDAVSLLQAQGLFVTSINLEVSEEQKEAKERRTKERRSRKRRKKARTSRERRSRKRRSRERRSQDRAIQARRRQLLKFKSTKRAYS